MNPSAHAVESVGLPEVSIGGVSGAARDNVVEALMIPASLVSDGQINQLWLNRYLRLVPTRVAQALEPFGYYAVVAEVRVNRDSSPMVVQVLVESGPPVRIASRHLEVTGAGHPELQMFIDRFPLEVGSVLLHLPYEKAKAELQALAVDLGYLDATYTRHEIRVNRENNTAEIDLVLQTGARFRFGPFRFTGAADYPEKFLRRYLATDQGAYFSYSELGKTQQKLLDCDRFSNVVFVPRREEALDDEIPVEIKLDEKPPKRLRPGAGYGTDSGARFFLRYQDVNFWRLGHEFSTNMMFAERRQNLTANYFFPGYRNVETLFALHGGYEAEDLDTYETHYYFAELEQLYGFAERKVGSVFFRLQREVSIISGDKNTSVLLMPGMRLRLTQLDDPVRPGRGYYISLEARGSWEKLGSDHSLVQFLGNFNSIYPLPWTSYLHLRGNAATTVQQDEFDDLPASLRFFAGGDNSVRGYAYQSLGPTNELGEVIGGKHLLVGSIELEKRFSDNWSVACFYDVGNSFNNLNDYKLAKAAGLGIRYFTLVGPVRIDVAKPFDAGESSYRLHVGLGIAW